ncbi:uncharacterized protein [Diabrotica undecimpunctata]|uniref:uncharacterized protein n=1 Tax=Diabrotica undecimpunctata TaxID=50387 RepID=UPI003B6326CD
MIKVSWDESLPTEIHTKWCKFRQELEHLNQCEIPRHMCECSIKIKIHGFCDASLEVYIACIFLRSIDLSGNINGNLLCAMSRVSPLKSRTIPKLELCGALLLSQLVNKTRASLNLDISEMFLWCDSPVVLCWIKTQPNILQTFVQHRVSQIQQTTTPDRWFYIITKENPADIVSRGCTPQFLLKWSLWWSGPPWLSQPSDSWPSHKQELLASIPELRKQTVIFLFTDPAITFPFKNFSKFNRLRRTIAYVHGFIFNLKAKRSGRKVGVLTSVELNQALLTLTKLAQIESFTEERRALLNHKPLPKTSRFSVLNPFLDQEGILRVGGKLQASSFSYDKKHPILLHHKHVLTKFIFEHEHTWLFDASQQLLLSSMRNKFWPPGTKTVRSCVDCF